MYRFFWGSVYIRNMFLKYRVIDGENIVKISRGIVEHIYEVKTFRLLKVRHKVLKLAHSLNIHCGQTILLKIL